MHEIAKLLGDLNPGKMKIGEAELSYIIDLLNEYLETNGIVVERLDLKGVMSHRAARMILSKETKDPDYNKVLSLVKACGGRLIVAINTEKK